jgi:hypothetical protein
VVFFLAMPVPHSNCPLVRLDNRPNARWSHAYLVPLCALFFSGPVAGSKRLPETAPDVRLLVDGVMGALMDLSDADRTASVWAPVSIVPMRRAASAGLRASGGGSGSGAGAGDRVVGHTRGALL